VVELPTGTTRLLLVRHGHSQHHVRRVAGGPTGDTGLTDEGRAQVAAAGRRLAVRYPDVAAVYSSTLARARETGALLAEALGLGGGAVREHCGLCSYHVLPAWDGRPHEDAWAAARRGGGVSLWRPEHEGGDTWAALVLRTAEALHEIADRHHGETVVVATHNETIQASLIALGDLPFRHRLGVSLAPASLTEWATDGDTTAGGPPDGFPFVDWRLVRLNDTGHLEA
jgi:2,3-bisphosphoglycerate-dependent phosphoglycerate mutase